MPKVTSTTKRDPYNERKDEKYWGVFYLNRAGHSQREIAELVELPLSTVNSIIARINKKDSPLPRTSSGAPMKVDERDLRHLRSIVTKNPFLSFDGVKHELEKFGVNVCRATVIEYLHSMGFGSHYAKKKPALTSQHKQKKNAWNGPRIMSIGPLINGPVSFGQMSLVMR